MMRYTLSDFTRILNNGIDNTIPEPSIKIINMLATHVGSPEYIKTPQFKSHLNNYSTSNMGIVRRKKKIQEINDDDWQTIRSFQTTELKKREGIEQNLHIIRKYLNMMTETTYNKLKEDIITEITNVISVDTNENLNYLCNELFQIVSSNILYSDIYAKLYNDLINEFNIFNIILMENFANFQSIFDNIEYYDSEAEYDKFCENNKKNEIKRATCSFYINLMKKDIIDKEVIGNIILNIFKKLDSMIISETQQNIIDELSELIYIMVSGSYETLNHNNFHLSKEIYDNVVRITNLKTKTTPGITNKCIFKHMDILDDIS